MQLEAVVVVSYLISNDTIQYTKMYEDVYRSIGVDQVEYSHLIAENSSIKPKSELLKRIKQNKKLCIMVNSNRITPFIYSDGSIYPCCAARGKELCLGNIYTDSLEDVLRG